MGRRKREPMSEGKKNIIGMLLEEYDIKSAKDIEDALKDLFGGTIQEMLESEMDEHLGYPPVTILRHFNLRFAGIAANLLCFLAIT